MYFSRIFLFLSILFVCDPFSLAAQSSVNDKEVRTLITLLDYISKDYAGAVEDGKVINEAEFEEISDFTQTCITFHENLVPQVNKDSFTALNVELEELKNSIISKSSQEQIGTQTRAIKEKILALELIKITPDTWPVLKSGMVIYNQKCQSCHGIEGKGDGILAAGLEPAPTNFQDSETRKNLTAIQAYNVAKLGLQGTAMRSFEELTEAELWDVSFYIMSLGHSPATAELQTLPVGLSLDAISQETDGNLEKRLTASKPSVTVSQIRQYEPKRTLPLDVAKSNLDASLQAYIDKDKDGAHKLALNAYLEGVELVENSLSATDKSLVISIEKAMLAYRNALKGDDLEVVEQSHALAYGLVVDAQDMLKSSSYSFSFTYGAALTILLREALEALLIIIVILSVLRPLKIKKAITFLHIGWTVALAAGVLSWLFVDQLVKISGSSRELMEGAGSLIAVVILIYMGTWLHSKSEIQKWKEFIEVKIQKISKSGNWWGLMLFSFIVVFREVFEVVLFLSALKLDIPEGSGSPLGWALLTSTIVIVIFAVLIIKYSKRLPIRQIFKLSALTMIILSVVLIGKGVSALQEAGWIGMNLLSDWMRFEPLGIYPTVQTILAQVLTIALTMVLWVFINRRNEELAKSKTV